MTFQKPDLRPSSSNEAPKLQDPFDRAVLNHWVTTDETQERKVCERTLQDSAITLLPNWASYLTRFQIHRCSIPRDGGLSSKHAAGVLYCQNYRVFICLLYKQNRVTVIVWVEMCGKLLQLTVGSLQHAALTRSTTNSPSIYQPPPPPPSSSSPTCSPPYDWSIVSYTAISRTRRRVIGLHWSRKFNFFLAHEEKYLILIELLTLNSNV